MESNMNGCIVCNGEIHDYEHASNLISESALVIAANGGLRHLARMDILPNVVVGDMDSDETRLQEGNDAVERIVSPEARYKTDAELAVDLAFERGCASVTLLGASGGRLDHTLGNICLAAKYPGRVALVEGHATLVAVDSSERCRIKGEEGSIVSLIPFPFAERIATSGLAYPLAKEDLSLGTRGISNALTQQEGCVCVSGGLLLVYVAYQRE
jgi:thiamine pyrophosphokinase